MVPKFFMVCSFEQAAMYGITDRCTTHGRGRMVHRRGAEAAGQGLISSI
jgi:hypothetical protein